MSMALILHDTPVGQYAFFGLLDPAHGTQFGEWDTFSVAIFKVESTKDGKGKKRGKTIIRIGGATDDPEYVYRRAQKICTVLNEVKPETLERARQIAGSVKRSTIERLPW